MPSLLAQYGGELDTGWAEELRPVEHAALVLLAAIAEEVHASGDHGLRFDYEACSGTRYRAQLRIDEAARSVVLVVFCELPHGLTTGDVPALVSHLNARVIGGRFVQPCGERALAFSRTTGIERESELEAIRRLVDACSLPLQLFEVAARRTARQQRRRRAH